MKKRVVSVLILIVGIFVGMGITKRKEGERYGKAQMMSNKHLALFLMMNQWVRVKQEGKNLSKYMEKKCYKKIAIYGMSYAGERLLDELKDSNITVKYGIDKKADEIYSEIDVVSPEKELETVDAIIVTSVFFMDEIKKELSAKVKCPIISLEDILYEL